MKTIKLDHITKIEGHARLHVAVEKGKLTKVELGAFEGARYFEGLIVGRKYYEVPIITSRICGICSCIHVTASLQALENAFDLKVSAQTKMLRELMCLGERIRSHAAHLYLFALPDYLGYESSLAMAPKYKAEVTRALELIKLGNNIITAIAGREMHPVAAIPGGFSKLPKQEELKELKQRLENQRAQALQTVRLFAKLKYPKFERKTQYFSLFDKGYSTISGEVRSSTRTIKPKSYSKHINETLREYSTAKFSTIDGKSFMVGSLARINNNHTTMSPDTKKEIRKLKLKFPIFNPFLNNLCQALELIEHFDRAIEILDNTKIKPEKPKKLNIKAANGVSAVEAPRGLLFHDYTFDNQGKLTKANIITPTAQNLNNLEQDLWAYIPRLLNYDDTKIKLEIEKLIRAYDPCFSCSAHFLELKLER
ncbi:Ni/Fe hydrogenase subunit alpha [Candidatus Woesearchaeota archaeon]|nr:Ni/Fe hydrogenase subunit alpha [Candidatus Woesearchaeota archaeon]